MSALHLVTGAAGLIGHALVLRLLAQDERVIALDSDRKGGLDDLVVLAARHPGRLEVVRADLARDPAALALALDGRRCDTIAHLAAIVGVQYVADHPYETLEVNLRSTLHLLDQALRSGCRALLFASSSENYAFGVGTGATPLPTPEDVAIGIAGPELPRWSYAASKIAGEAAVFAAAREGGFTPLVVRFHNVYGPRMPPTHVVPDLLERCARGEDPLVVRGPEQTRSFLYVEDAARALARLLARAAPAPAGV